MIEIFLGLLMAVAHYFGLLFSAKNREFYVYLLSFSAGVSITYLFVDLLPNFALDAPDRTIFFSILVGFIAIHLVEKHIYQKESEDKHKMLSAVEAAVSFIYHFAIGIILTSFLMSDFIEGILFFIPVLLYTTFDTLPVEGHPSFLVRLIVSFSTLLGIIYRSILHTSMGFATERIILGLVIGIIAFSVIRHSIPWAKEGKPLYFIFGVIFYTIVLIIFS